MAPGMQAVKLAMIRRLASVREIAGWREGLRLSGRAPFPGELVALEQRRRELEGRG